MSAIADNEVASEDVQCDASPTPSQKVVNEGGDNVIGSNSTGGSSEDNCVIVAERTEAPIKTPLGKAAEQEQDCSIRGE